MSVVIIDLGLACFAGSGHFVRSRLKIDFNVAMPRATARKGKPKNVRRSEKLNKSASDSGDAETLASLRSRLRSSTTEDPSTGAAAATSAAGGGSPSSPWRRGPLGAASWNFVAYRGGRRVAVVRRHAAVGSRRGFARRGSVGPRWRPGCGRGQRTARSASSCTCCESESFASCSASGPSPPAPPPVPPPGPVPPPIPVPSPAATGESPEARAARFAALAADREREVLDLDRLNKVTKAQRASEDAAYKKLVADRVKEQAAWDQKIADSKRKLDASEDALRRVTSLEQEAGSGSDESDVEAGR